MEFSKFLILIDYIAMVVLVVLCLKFDWMITVAVTWAGQLAISTGFYFWKSRMENRVKLPILLLKSLPSELRDQLDLTEVIKSIIGGD